MAVIIDLEKTSLLRAAPRLMQIRRVLMRRKFLQAYIVRQDSAERAKDE